MTEIIDDPTMVERVAKAIWMENQPAGAPSYDDLDFLDQGRVKMIARACIKAMREPTDEMLQSVSSFVDIAHIDQDPIYYWTRMIDAALKED